ncbi:MAG TPA: hypothetical protein ENH94_05675 [Phycisphaerales bacterium]|nr:hypothetical protein [Phycisphaerales bacterium]
MADENQNEHPSLTKAFCVGILIDAILPAITFMIPGYRVIFWAFLGIAIAHLVCGVGLVFYRRGNLTDSDFGFVRFGLLSVLWKLFKITG